MLRSTLVSNNNIHFCGKIKKKYFPDPTALISGAMWTSPDATHMKSTNVPLFQQYYIPANLALEPYQVQSRSSRPDILRMNKLKSADNFILFNIFDKKNKISKLLISVRICCKGEGCVKLRKWT